MKRFLSILVPLSLYGMSSDAYAALSCKEIVELHSYNTKSDIIIKMMKSNPVGFGAGEVECLKKNFQLMKSVIFIPLLLMLYQNVVLI